VDYVTEVAGTLAMIGNSFSYVLTYGSNAPAAVIIHPFDPADPTAQLASALIMRFGR
jgi:hypothetical protein